jgi:hypothetical protein
MNLKTQAALSGLLFIGGIATAETTVTFSKLPAAVQNAARAELHGAQVVGASSEKERGRTTYEVETTLNGKSRDMTFDAKGDLLEVEQQLDLNTMPARARAALIKMAGDGTIRKVESVTAGQSVSYEAAITTKSGKHTEAAVNPDGSLHRD